MSKYPGLDDGCAGELMQIYKDGTIGPVVTLHDRVAMAALTGLLAAAPFGATEDETPYEATCRLFVRSAFAMADEFMKQRSAKKEKKP